MSSFASTMCHSAFLRGNRDSGHRNTSGEVSGVFQ